MWCSSISWVCVCVCFVCLLIKLHISAQSGPVILVILYATRINWSSHGSRCVCVLYPCSNTRGYGCQSDFIRGYIEVNRSTDRVVFIGSAHTTPNSHGTHITLRRISTIDLIDLTSLIPQTYRISNIEPDRPMF